MHSFIRFIPSISLTIHPDFLLRKLFIVETLQLKVCPGHRYIDLWCVLLWRVASAQARHNPVGRRSIVQSSKPNERTDSTRLTRSHTVLIEHRWPGYFSALFGESYCGMRLACVSRVRPWRDQTITYTKRRKRILYWAPDLFILVSSVPPTRTKLSADTV